MKNYISAKLSSKYSQLTFAGLFVASVIMVPILILLIANFEMKPNILIGGILFLLATALLVFSALNLAEARIENNKFYLKKFLRPEKVYDVRALCGLNIYNAGKDDYIVFSMKNGAEKEKFLVCTTRRILFAHEKLNTETILREILEDNQKNGFN